MSDSLLSTPFPRKAAGRWDCTVIHIFFINSLALGGLGISPALNMNPQNKLLQAGGKERMPIHGICVLALFPRFLEPFFVPCWCSPLLPAPVAVPAAAREGGTKAACAASGDSWWLSPALETSARLQVLGGDEHCCCFLGEWWEFGIFICSTGEWQKGILHKHALKGLQPFPAQCSKMGFPLPTTQITLLKNCGLILEHKCLCEGCWAHLEQGLFLS